MSKKTSNEDILKEWNDFIKSDKYAIYFLSSIEIWYKNFNEL